MASSKQSPRVQPSSGSGAPTASPRPTIGASKSSAAAKAAEAAAQAAAAAALAASVPVIPPVPEKTAEQKQKELDDEAAARANAAAEQRFREQNRIAKLTADQSMTRLHTCCGDRPGLVWSGLVWSGADSDMMCCVLCVGWCTERQTAFDILLNELKTTRFLPWLDLNEQQHIRIEQARTAIAKRYIPHRHSYHHTNHSPLTNH